MENNYKRLLNISFGKSGSGSITPRLVLPKNWINIMGLTTENRQVVATFDEEKKQITIKSI